MTTLKQKAIRNGIKPSVVYNRLKQGWPEDAALNTPVRGYKKKKVHGVKKSDRVWQYLLKNKLATPKEVSVNCDVSYGYAHKLMSKIGTPREVFEREAQIEMDFGDAVVAPAARASVGDEIAITTSHSPRRRLVDVYSELLTGLVIAFVVIAVLYLK